MAKLEISPNYSKGWRLNPKLTNHHKAYKLYVFVDTLFQVLSYELLSWRIVTQLQFQLSNLYMRMVTQ
jgi:hypothetical protein